MVRQTRMKNDGASVARGVYTSARARRPLLNLEIQCNP
jgi:hypothetical protein